MYPFCSSLSINMYKCKNFKIYELVDKKTFENNPEWKLWLAFDDRLLIILDILREQLNVSITINNWKWGKDREWSGLRPPESPYYSQFSQHSFGRAVDALFSGIPAHVVRAKIKELMESGRFNGIIDSITCEETKSYRDSKTNPLSWVHLDLRINDVGYNEFYI